MGLVPGMTPQVAFSEEVPVRWAHAALRDVVGAPVSRLLPPGPLLSHFVPSASCFQLWPWRGVLKDTVRDQQTAHTSGLGPSCCGPAETPMEVSLAQISVILSTEDKLGEGTLEGY